MMPVLLVLFGLLLLCMPLTASAQQTPPSWEEIALQAQRNAAAEQMLSTAAITALQSDIASLKAELAKLKAPPEQAPPAK